MKEPSTIRIFSRPEDVIRHAARTLKDLCDAKAEGRISVALSGGSTPSQLFRFLAEDFARDIPWQRLEIFFGDERCVAPDHPDSNFRMASIELLSRAPIPPAQIHRMPADALDLDGAARAYEDTIVDLVPAGALGEPAFDLIWLGLGEDGHTASLFPGTSALTVRDRLVVPNDVPQLKTRRLTFTFQLLTGARRIQFLVLGPRKAEMVRAILSPAAEDATRTSLPAAWVHARDGVVEWLLDSEAASGLDEPEPGS